MVHRDVRPRIRGAWYEHHDPAGGKKDDMIADAIEQWKEKCSRLANFGAELAVEEIQVPSITLNELLEQVGVSEIDLLAMDIEGHELPALRGIDLERYRPELIVVEGNRGPVISHLTERGYEVIERYRPFDRINTYLRRRDGNAAP